jgi:hypothetical protein
MNMNIVTGAMDEGKKLLASSVPIMVESRQKEVSKDLST